jgi:hypothetical protein
MTAGEILRTARQQRSLSIEDVSQRTKIRPKIIESMERDDFAALPATYMTGFVRTYSQFLDVTALPDIPAFANLKQTVVSSATDVRASFAAAKQANDARGITPNVDGTRPAKNNENNENNEDRTEDADRASKRKRIWSTNRSENAASAAKFADPNGQPAWMKYLYGTLGVLTLGACGLLFWQKTFGLQTPELPVITLSKSDISTASAPAPKPLAITGDASTDKALINGGGNVGSSGAAKSDTAAAGSVVASLANAVGNALGTAPQAAPDSLILEAKAIESAWINVVMDRKRSEQVTLEAGKTYRWAAEERITLQLGNAGGVQFRRNGIPIEPLGKSGSVVRNVLITREGLYSSNSPVLAQRLAANEAGTTSNAAATNGGSATAAVSTAIINTTTTRRTGDGSGGTASSLSSSSLSSSSLSSEPKFDAKMTTKDTKSDTIRRFFPRSVKRVAPKTKIIEAVTRSLTLPDTRQQIPMPKISQQPAGTEKRN